MTTVVVAWPLWGLVLEASGDVPLAGFVLRHGTWQRWMDFEKTDLVRELAGRWWAEEGLGSTPAVTAPVLLEAEQDSGDDDSGLGVLAGMAPAASRVVDALRLHAAGDLVHPAEVGDYLRVGMWARRAARPYRSAPYRLRFADPYRFGPADVAPVERLVTLLGTPAAGCDNARLALAAHRGAHALQVHPDERALLLFSALEALLGGLRHPVAGTPFPVRLARAVGGADPGVQRWFEGEARQWRNRLAHGATRHHPPTDRPVVTRRFDGGRVTSVAVPAAVHLLGRGGAAEPALVRLAEVTRRVLVAFLEHGASAAVDPGDPVGSFNAALAAR